MRSGATPFASVPLFLANLAIAERIIAMFKAHRVPCPELPPPPPLPAPQVLLTAVPQPGWASASGKDAYGTWADLTIAGVTQRMRWIAAGTFVMGSPPTESERSEEEVAHRVTLTEGFWMADSPCTQEFWQLVMENHPAFQVGEPRFPVETVSWNCVQHFLRRLAMLSWRRVPAAERGAVGIRMPGVEPRSLPGSGPPCPRLLR